MGPRKHSSSMDGSISTREAEDPDCHPMGMFAGEEEEEDSQDVCVFAFEGGPQDDEDADIGHYQLELVGLDDTDADANLATVPPNGHGGPVFDLLVGNTSLPEGSSQGD